MSRAWLTAIVIDALPTLASLGGVLASPWMRGVLITLFLLCFYVAVSVPGHGWPEVATILVLAVLLGAPLAVGTAQWWEIVAVLLGVGLIAIELFLLPGFGWSGVLGIALVLAGLTLAFVRPEASPRSAVEAIAGNTRSISISLTIVAAGLMASLLLWTWLSRYIAELPFIHRVVLATPSDVSATPEDRQSELIVGDVGQALTDLSPGGTARFDVTPRLISVVSDGGYVVKGTAIVVREIGGNRIIVRPVAGGPA